MKFIQMQYSPDAFDSFMKQKLNEVEADSSMADEYWSKLDKDLTQKKGLSARNKFFYFSVCLLILSSIVYLTYNDSAVAPIKDNAIKPSPVSMEKKEASNSKTSGVRTGDKANINIKGSGNTTSKVESKKKQEPKAGNRTTDNTSIGDKASAIENITPANTDIPVSTYSKTIVQSPSVIAKDSIKAVIEPSIINPKKKKNAVTIIW
jgi:hypothetical protein